MGSIDTEHANGQTNGHSDLDGHGYPRPPLRQSGLLNSKFESEDATPIIGREFPKLNIVDNLLNAPER